MAGVFLDVDECVSDPCVNGGSCINKPLSFECRCPPGYVGDRCQYGVLASAVIDHSKDSPDYGLSVTRCQRATASPN